MDELKLEKWRANFTAQAQTLKIEFDAFFTGKKMEEFYEIKVDDESQNLSLVFFDKDRLPKEIEKRLLEILYKTQLEDSI